MRRGESISGWAKAKIDDGCDLGMPILLLVAAAFLLTAQNSGMFKIISKQMTNVGKAAGLVQQGKTQVSRVRDAIVGQESGGDDPSVENHSGSGAMGIAQVMPENVAAWSREALGRHVTEQEFKSDPDLQKQIIDFKIQQYLDSASREAINEEEQVKRVAATWYSGDPNLFASTKPQYWGKDRYPSIAEYSNQVWERYQAQTQSSNNE